MSESKRGTVWSSRKNPETGELKFYEMTPEEAEETINGIIQTMERLPAAAPAKPKTVKGEARRGARNARRFLAENPTQEEIQWNWQWTWDDMELGCGCPVCLAYLKAYQKVLRRRLI